MPMTAKELREKLGKMNDNTQVVVQWEHDGVLDLFEIDDVSKSVGVPKRIQGKAGFAFVQDKDAVERVFITVEPA